MWPQSQFPLHVSVSYTEKRGVGEVGTRVSFGTSFDSKQPKLEPKLVSALSETKRLFRLFRLFRLDVSVLQLPGIVLYAASGRVCPTAACLPSTNLCCSLSCHCRTCLYYSSLLPLDISVLQQPVLPGRFFSTEACAASDKSVLKQPVLPLNGELPLHVSVLMFYSRLCCL